MAVEGRPTGSWWVENLLRPVLVAAMLACLAAPIVIVLEWLFGDWDGTYFLVFALVAGLEGILSERALQKRGITGYQYLISRGAEVLILLLLLKFARYIPLGFDQLWANAQLWSADMSQFLTNEDFFLAFVFLPLWAGAILVARVVTELDVEEREESPPPDKTSAAYYIWLNRPSPLSNRQEVLDHLGELFVWGGIAILLVSTVIHFMVSSALALAVPTMLYFALGIALLSQGRFSVLHAGWQIQRIPVQQGVGRRWLLWAVIFLVIVALAALLLPTSYTMGPVLALLGLFSLLLNVLSFIIFLIIFLLALPLALLFPRMEEPVQPQFEPGPLLGPEEITRGTSPWEVIVSVVFWTVVLAIVGYALFRFFKDRFSSLPDEEAKATWWGRLLMWLRDLWRRWRTWQQAVQTRLTRRRAGQRDERLSAGRPFRFFFPGRLSPREMVRYYYLSTARRAAQAGQSRRPGQTPYEYQGTLDKRFPGLEPDLTGLTDAFVQAQYSHQPVQREDAAAVKPFWQRLKAALRRRRIRP